MTMREIFACSCGAVSGTDRFPHLLKLDPHVVHIGVHSDQVYVFIGSRPSIAPDFSFIPETNEQNYNHK